MLLPNCAFGLLVPCGNRLIFCLPSFSVEVSVFKYQPGVSTPVEQLHNYRISSRGGAITGSLSQTEERRGENVSGSVDIATGMSSYRSGASHWVCQLLRCKLKHP